jgi:hypothetical protein
MEAHEACRCAWKLLDELRRALLLRGPASVERCFPIHIQDEGESVSGIPVKRTPEALAEAARLYGEGLGYEAIGRRLGGVSGTTVHMWLDPDFAAHRRRLINTHRAGKFSGHEAHRVDIRPSAEDVEKGLRAIPKDTRDLTALLCGDPLPGRRAIDRVLERTRNLLSGDNALSAVD